MVKRIEEEPNLRATVQIKKLAAFEYAKAFDLSEGGFDWNVTCFRYTI